jgi:hypothetical protein
VDINKSLIELMGAQAGVDARRGRVRQRIGPLPAPSGYLTKTLGILNIHRRQRHRGTGFTIDGDGPVAGGVLLRKRPRTSSNAARRHRPSMAGTTPPSVTTRCKNTYRAARCSSGV